MYREEFIEALKREVHKETKEFINVGCVNFLIDHLAATGRLLPEGCVAVPLNPTKEMYVAGMNSLGACYADRANMAKSVYKAMISAAKRGY
ncbi:hypothetical protein [Caudoviricetes sp.]|nr:hypothetical protein [Caudoviricetes sp.]